jgi:wobble nucleotide-excising tRNase
MLQRFVSIRNVGRFRSCAAAGDVTLRRATLIYAENGRGKTTLCAILRSLGTNAPDLVLGRTTLGAGAPPEINLLLRGPQNAFFRNGSWDAPYPDIAVFDATYVSENVYAGEVVDTEHRRNLYRVIVGAQGVALANRVNELDTEIRAKTTDIRESRAGLQRYLPERMSIEMFQALPLDDQIDDKIATKLQEQQAAQQVSELLRRGSLQLVAIPIFPTAFAAMLAKTLPDVSAEAERRVTEHIAKHVLGETGEQWLSDGLRKVRDDCPFCGQPLDGIELIAAYRGYFSEAYHRLKREVSQLQLTIDTALAERVAASIERTILQNSNDAEFWQTFCRLEPPVLAEAGRVAEVLTMLRDACHVLLEQKTAAPLDAVAPDERYTQVLESFEQLRVSLAAYNACVAAVDAVVQEKKRATRAADLADIGVRLATLRAQQARHTAELVTLCDRETGLQQEKGRLEGEKARVRGLLDAHTAQVIALYGQSINRYLERINAGFRITVPVHNYRGGTPSTSYQIVINQTSIDVGDADTPASSPSFRNTLSSGDKSTLALAFFLAQLQQDQSLAQKIIVFDDPFTSLDAFRRSHTVHQVYKCVSESAQVIVLSHDANFLKALWDRLAPADRKTLQLARVGEENTTIVEWNIEQAVQARLKADIDALMKYYSLNEGTPREVIQRIRPVLEGYCRNLYPTQFGEDTLGEIIGRIRVVGPGHPLTPIAEELDELNVFCRRYHHGDNPGAAGEPIDDAELLGYVARTMKLVGCQL